MNDSKKTVLFDLDGTLVDSAPSITNALNVMLREAGHLSIDIEDVRPRLGNDARDLIATALVDQGVSSESVDIAALASRFLDIYRASPTEGSVLYPDCMEVLENCRAQGFKLAICTNKPSKTATPVLELFSLSPLFDVIVCGDQAMHKKPDGRHILEILEQTLSVPASAIMVGDAANDIVAANNAGVRSILVEYGYDPVGAAVEKPTYTAANLRQVWLHIQDALGT